MLVLLSLLISTVQGTVDIISFDATETIIPTTNIATSFTYLDGATYDTFANVISIRSGIPNQISSATANYCFRNEHDKFLNKIIFDYRYSWGFHSQSNAATAKLVLIDAISATILWESGPIGPFDEARYWWHYNGCNGCESNYSPRMHKEFSNLHLNVRDKNVKLQIEFTNNDRN
eukprot:179156_1